MSYLDSLVNRSIYILRETHAQFTHPCVLWSTGKDSTAVLNLCRDAFFGEVPFPVVHIDTGWKFPEIYTFRDTITKQWGLDLHVVRSPQAGQMNPNHGTSHLDCCHTLKTDVLMRTIESNGFDAVIVSIRRDEHYMRNLERVSSPRDRAGHWQFIREKQDGEGGDAPVVSLQHPELWTLLQSDFGSDTHHVRRHPILHWDEVDVWHYTQARGLPVNPLYFANNGHRYRSLGCHTCTSPIDSAAATIDAIVAEIETTQTPERSGRAQDKEQEQVMRKLRAMGYM